MLLTQDSSSWNSRIVYHVKSNQFQHALILYHKMMEASLNPSGYILVALVNACADLQNISHGKELHAEIARKGLLGFNVYAGNAMINLYLKCGLLSLAREVFENLHVLDVVSWTSMIGGYVTHGLGMEALVLFEHMQRGEHLPNNVTFICAFKACGCVRSASMAKELHDKLERRETPKEDLAVCNALVDMYIKCGLLPEGQKLFDKLKNHDRISWSALIMGYTSSKNGATALQCFHQMQLEGFVPDIVAFICLLKACGLIKYTSYVQGLHSVIVTLGVLEIDPVIGNVILDAYVGCKFPDKAQDLFHSLPVRDNVSWNTLVDGFIRQDRGENVLFLLRRMQLEAIYFDIITWVCCLKACGLARDVHNAKHFHASLGSLQMELLVGNALIDMYAKCGLLVNACEVFDKMLDHDVVSWTTLITGYVNHQLPRQALKFFQRMSADQVSPNAATVACVLKACGLLKATQHGMEIHSEIERQGLVGKDIVVSNALIDMYSKCDMLKAATEVFESACIKDVASWNALMTAYIRHGCIKNVLDCMTQMSEVGIHPNSITFICCVKACGCGGMVIEGIELHAEMARSGLVFSDISVGNALVDMYINFGHLARTKDVFYELPYQNVLSWTSLIAGFVQHEHGQQALLCFDEMQLKGVIPDAATFICSLKACKSVGAMGRGREMHAEVARLGLPDRDSVVYNSLIEMYASCGLLKTALEVFDELQVHDTVSWTALIAGYVQLGEVDCALDAFQRMEQEGKSADAVTFLWILIGFAFVGEVEIAEMFFKSMIDVYGIVPSIQHYTCVADLFCRGGHISEAVAFIDRLPVEPDPVVWCVLLDSCQKFGHVEACREVFKQSVRLNTKDASAYVSVCKMYVDLESKAEINSIHHDGNDAFVCFQAIEEGDILLSS